jgi:hypothetical protein
MLTILYQPGQAFNSANNDVFYTVSGSTYLAPNTVGYQYVANIFEVGSSTPICTMTAFPDPVYGYGVFNLQKIVSQLVSYDYFFSDSGEQPFQLCPNSCIELYLTFSEQYTSGTTFVQSGALATSNSTYFINSSLPFLNEDQGVEGQEALISYIPGSSGNYNFLIGEYRDLGTYSTYVTQSQWLYFISYNHSAQYLNIVTYNGAGDQVGEYKATNPNVESNGVQAVDAGYGQLSNFATRGTYTTVSGPATLFGGGDETSYTLTISNSGTTAIGGPVSFNIETDCGKYAALDYSVYFLNSLGGFDSWLFSKKNQTTTKKQQSQYKKTMGTLNPDGSYTIQTYESNTVPYYTKLQDTIDFNTDQLTDKEVTFLRDLFSSPAVYIQQGNAGGPLIAVTVVPNDNPVNKIVNKKIYNLNLTVETSYNDFRQPR